MGICVNLPSFAQQFVGLVKWPRVPGFAFSPSKGTRKVGKAKGITAMCSRISAMPCPAKGHDIKWRHHKKGCALKGHRPSIGFCVRTLPTNLVWADIFGCSLKATAKQRHSIGSIGLILPSLSLIFYNFSIYGHSWQMSQNSKRIFCKACPDNRRICHRLPKGKPKLAGVPLFYLIAEMPRSQSTP